MNSRLLKVTVKLLALDVVVAILFSEKALNQLFVEFKVRVRQN